MTKNPWIEAFRILDKTPSEKVLCPNCNKDFLNVTERESELDSSARERLLSCKNCGAQVEARIPKASGERVTSSEGHKPGFVDTAYDVFFRPNQQNSKN